MLNTHVNGAQSSQGSVAAGEQILPVNRSLRSAAEKVVSAADVFDLHEVRKIDLNFVFIESGGSAYSPSSSAVEEGEELIYEIVCCDDHVAVDQAIEKFRALAAESSVPFSVFAPPVFQEARQRMGSAAELLSPRLPAEMFKSVDALQESCDRLLSEFATQRAQGLWHETAATWQKLAKTLIELGRVQESIKFRYELRLPERTLPKWMFRPLPIGPITRSGHTVKIELAKVVAGVWWASVDALLT